MVARDKLRSLEIRIRSADRGPRRDGDEALAESL
jgi:hypothetical protein